MNNNPTKNEIDFVREMLYEFNNKIVGKDGHKAINIVEYDN